MITEFEGEYRFLSNFFSSPIKVNTAAGIFVFPSVENAYQAAKCNKISDIKQFTDCFAGVAKKLGRNVELRPDWNKIRLQVMTNLVEIKFQTNAELKHKLLQTEHLQLVEGNYWHDNYWGNCICTKCSNIEGQNHLGKILMQLRQRYHEEIDAPKELIT